MTRTLKQIKNLIRKYRDLFRADKSRPLVKVTDDDLESQDAAHPQNLTAHFPEESALTDAYPDVSTRQPSNVARTYNPDICNGYDATSEADIDLTRDDQLDAYANGMKIPPETLEKWIAAGILSPEEIRTAEKLLKLIRQKKHRNGITRKS